VNARGALELVADRGAQLGGGVGVGELADLRLRAQLRQIEDRDIFATPGEQRPRGIELADRVLLFRSLDEIRERERIELLARRLTRIRRVAGLRAAARPRHEVEFEPR
jgi:hypothetical protein